MATLINGIVFQELLQHLEFGDVVIFAFPPEDIAGEGSIWSGLAGASPVVESWKHKINNKTNSMNGKTGNKA